VPVDELPLFHTVKTTVIDGWRFIAAIILSSDDWADGWAAYMAGIAVNIINNAASKIRM